MDSPLRDAIDAWTFPTAGTLALLLVVLVYLRGWVRLRRAAPDDPWSWRLTAFVGGILALWIAVGSPLGTFDHALLTFHMVQHLVLMTVAAPLILIGAPVVTLLRGLRPGFVLHEPGPLSRPRPLRALGSLVTHPLTCWLAAAVAVVGWHVPAAFELGMQSPGWHAFQRTSFLVAGLLFWWPIVRPWPAAAKASQWSLPTYLFLATLPCDALSAFLAFCGRALYSSRLCGHVVGETARLEDQASAGALMWFWVTVAYLTPAVWIVIQLLSPSHSRDRRRGPPEPRPVARLGQSKMRIHP